MDASTKDRGIYAFGPFRLDAVRRSLTRDGEKLALAPRLFDTLLYLVENHGRLIDKDELFSAVWGGRVVEEANLTQTIFGLRKILGPEAGGGSFIATVPGRGYRFAAPVSTQAGAAPIVPPKELKLAELASFSQPLSEPRNDSAKPALVLGGWTARPISTVCTIGAVCVAVVAWIALPATRPAEKTAPPSFEPPAHSVAVLPFNNVGGDPAQEYFSDGLADELINQLSQIEALHVVARTSAFFFKGKPITVAAIARTLNVGTILEGSVRRERNRLRITAELIDTKSGFAIWSHSYDRDQGDILNVEDEIAKAVAQSLQTTLLNDEAKKLDIGGTRNPFALDAYLRGRRFELEEDLSGEKAAVAAYEEAIKLDTNYALAYVRYSIALRYVAGFQDNVNPSLMKEIRRLQSVEADRAITLAPNLGMAHMAKSAALEDQDRNYISAAQEDYRALALSPGDANTLRTAPIDLLLLTGKDAEKWLSFAKRSIELDPLSPFGYRAVTLIYLIMHRYEDAMAALRHKQQLGLTPPVEDTNTLGILEILNGSPQSAIQVCSGKRNYLEDLCLALAYHAIGMQSDATLELEKVHATRGDASAYDYATVYSQWGQTAEALHWLQIAYQTRDSDIEYMRTDPLLDPIRDTSAFKELLKEINFPN